MSFFYLLIGVLLVLALILFVRNLLLASIAADPECDYEEGDEEIVAMGGQVDEHECLSEEDEEPSEEEESKS